MNPLLPKVKLTTFLLINTLAYCFASGFQKGDPLPTEGTQEGFPFVSSWNGSDRLGYSGDSFTSKTSNLDLGALLDMGAPESDYDTRVSEIPPLDGSSSSTTWPRTHYSMKFVAYDMRLGRLKTIDPVARTFTIQLQMFLQWQEWRRNDTASSSESCTSFCDTTRSEVAMKCCDYTWLPVLRFPNADVAQMDSIVTNGRGITFSFVDDPEADCVLPPNSDVTGNATCFRQRFWELSVEAACEAKMDFRNFPLEFQQLSVDIRNPYSSRTWLHLGPGSLEARANNLIQKMSEDASNVGWRVIDVIVLPLCDAVSWKSTFFSIDAHLVNKSVTGGYASQAEQIEQYLKNLTCPKLNSWPHNLSRMQVDPRDIKAFASIKQYYLERLVNTRNAYKQCVGEKGSVYSPRRPSDESLTNLGWIDFNDPDLKVSIPCMIDAVVNLTTPGIRVSILVKRYPMYYMVKLIIPMIVCVLFAFAAVAIEVEEVGARLAVVVPAAIALTALQVLVVATDIPVISYIVPTTWLMLSSYLVILLICIEIAIVRILWKFQEDARKSETGATKKAEEDDTSTTTTVPTSTTTSRNKWTDSRNIDIGLMCMIFVLYMIIILVCILVPANHRPPQMQGGVSIWNANNIV